VKPLESGDDLVGVLLWHKVRSLVRPKRDNVGVAIRKKTIAIRVQELSRIRAGPETSELAIHFGMYLCHVVDMANLDCLLSRC
jgi:hypothetical protein